MNAHPTTPRLQPLAKLLRLYLRSSLRGRTRLTFLLANKVDSLHTVPVTIEDRPPVYVDLRFDMSHEWLRGSPWPTAPFELDEQAVMRAVVRPGETAYDIGANMGIHTALLSRLVGPTGNVIAFEPNVELIPALSRTITELGNASLYCCALSDHDGESELYVPNDHSMGSLSDYTSDPELAEWRASIKLKKAKTLTCELKSLDGLVAEKALPLPDYIKCDVEGAELMVFSGAKEILDREEAPIILFESLEKCSRGFGLEKSAASDFLASLQNPNYQFFEVCKGGELKPVASSNFDNPNLLAVPYSKLGRLST